MRCIVSPGQTTYNSQYSRGVGQAVPAEGTLCGCTDLPTAHGRGRSPLFPREAAGGCRVPGAGQGRKGYERPAPASGRREPGLPGSRPTTAPQLFDILAARTIQREDYTLTVRITRTGHMVSWANPDVFLTEVRRRD